jgi:cell division transport system permease protein
VVSVRAALDPASSRATFRDLARRLASAVPEATLDTHEAWVDRLAVLLRALEASAWGALALVGAVASLVVATATRAGLSARRSTVTLLHGLGATDGYISGRFALRAMVLAAIGGSAGTLGAVPVLLAIARLGGAADPPETLGATLASLQPPLWVGLAALPVIAAAIGFGTAQGTVQLWLRRLP